MSAKNLNDYGSVMNGPMKKFRPKVQGIEISCSFPWLHCITRTVLRESERGLSNASHSFLGHPGNDIENHPEAYKLDFLLAIKNRKQNSPAANHSPYDQLRRSLATNCEYCLLGSTIRSISYVTRLLLLVITTGERCIS